MRMQKDECRPQISISFIILTSAFCLFLILGAYQLHLPGLHYDEAKEAGLNAMQLATGQPVTAFRDAAVQIGPWRLPLMVQDYIGALNVVLATPFLALGGVNTVALRWLPLLIAALTLIVTWRVAWRLGGASAASATVLLLAVNPSFVFWSRQGIFVTNLTALFFMASVLTALRWWSGRRPRDLWLTAFLWGLGIYAKLLFVWAIGAMVILAVVAGLLEARSSKLEAGRLETRSWKHPAFTLTLAFASFVLPLVPLILFNIRTSGTLISIFGNLGKSYYGVDNSAYLPNLSIRLQQLLALLRGDHFWYLGEVFTNAWAPWAAAFLIATMLLVSLAGSLKAEGRGSGGAEARRGEEVYLRLRHGVPSLLRFSAPLLLLALMVAQSAFTVSDLFITHYAILLPLIPLAGGLAFGAVWESRNREAGTSAPPLLHSSAPLPLLRSSAPRLLRPLAAALSLVALLAWAGGDLRSTLDYHRLLTLSGGYGSHSDAIYRLAEYLDRGGFSSPLALDWGLDAPVRFLTAGRVQPIEAFGYASLDRPDAGFAERIGPFLDNPDMVYLAHSAEYTVFRARADALGALAAERGRTVRVEMVFGERSGRQLYVVYRVVK